MSRDALVVGINYYAGSQRLCLNTPVNDANAVADILKQGGFRVTRLLATNAQNPVTASMLEAALIKLFNPESEQYPDTALFYFSGHGFKAQAMHKPVYLATSETNPKAGRFGVRLTDLRDLLIASPIKQQLVWLDCCYSGEFVSCQDGNPGSAGPVRDRCFIAASRNFESAYAMPRQKHSVMTQALLAGLQQPGSGWLTDRNLVSFVDDRLQNVVQGLVADNYGQSINLIHRVDSAEELPDGTPPSSETHDSAALDAKDEQIAFYKEQIQQKDDLVKEIVRTMTEKDSVKQEFQGPVYGAPGVVEGNQVINVNPQENMNVAATGDIPLASGSSEQPLQPKALSDYVMPESLELEAENELTEAIRAAFPSESLVERMLKRQLGVKLNTIKQNAPTILDTVDSVVEWAIAQGRLPDLWRGCTAMNPGNPELKAFALKWLS